VFSFSVLTHIHPRNFRDWFAEIARIILPGGLAYLTFNGDAVLTSPKPHHAPYAEDYKARGWYWMEQEGHYKSSAGASHEFVTEAAGGIFRVHKIVRRDYAGMDALFAEPV